VPEDERALRARLAALEAEVKGEADANRARKEAALANVRERRAKELAERQALRDRQAELVTGKSRRSEPTPAPESSDGDDEHESMFSTGRAALRGDTGSALELARKAQGVKGELAKPRKAGDKSWKTSGLLSLAFGPVGWLYAGSFRESIPAAAAWLALAALVTKVLPFFTFLMLPVLMIALPLSGIAGVFYAVQHNRHGKRVRLFGKDDPKLDGKKAAKQLPAGRKA
jgi:hypothetical protein